MRRHVSCFHLARPPVICHAVRLMAAHRSEHVGYHILKTATPFQPHLVSMLMQFITPGSTVVDAGANFGSFSVFFAAQTGATGTVHAFEPQQRMYELLCTNKVVNNLPQLRLHNAALSYAAGTLQMSATIPDGKSANRSFAEADAAADTPLNYGGMRLGKGGEAVDAITLDSLALRNVSLIKVDVQGAERLTFYGARETIKSNLPVVAFESFEVKLAEGVASDLALPPAVAAFDYEAFLKDLGYIMPQARLTKYTPAATLTDHITNTIHTTGRHATPRHVTPALAAQWVSLRFGACCTLPCGTARRTSTGSDRAQTTSTCENRAGMCLGLLDVPWAA
jgi:FkbM family methyltransferase